MSWPGYLQHYPAGTWQTSDRAEQAKEEMLYCSLVRVGASTRLVSQYQQVSRITKMSFWGFAILHEISSA